MIGGDGCCRIWLLIPMVAIGIAPLISVVLAGPVAEQNGCSVHEGFVQHCIVSGTDIGGVLYTMGVTGMAHAGFDLPIRGRVVGWAWEVGLLITRKLTCSDLHRHGFLSPPISSRSE